MIHHIVTFRLEGDCAAVAKAARDFKQALEALPGKVKAVQAMSVHLNDVAADGNWTLMLHAECADKASLAEYANHPEHLACVAIIKPMISGRACVDYTE